MFQSLSLVTRRNSRCQRQGIHTSDISSDKSPAILSLVFSPLAIWASLTARNLAGGEICRRQRDLSLVVRKPYRRPRGVYLAARKSRWRRELSIVCMSCRWQRELLLATSDKDWNIWIFGEKSSDKNECESIRMQYPFYSAVQSRLLTWRSTSRPEVGLNF